MCLNRDSLCKRGLQAPPSGKSSIGQAREICLELFSLREGLACWGLCRISWVTKACDREGHAGPGPAEASPLWLVVSEAPSEPAGWRRGLLPGSPASLWVTPAKGNSESILLRTKIHRVGTDSLLYLRNLKPLNGPALPPTKQKRTLNLPLKCNWLLLSLAVSIKQTSRLPFSFSLSLVDPEFSEAMSIDIASVVGWGPLKCRISYNTVSLDTPSLGGKGRSNL